MKDLALLSTCLLLNIIVAAWADWSSFTVACLLVTFCIWLAVLVGEVGK